MDGMLLQTVEGLGHSPFPQYPGEIWQLLQAEKEDVSRDLVIESSLYASANGDGSPTDGEIEFRHRGQLEARLREINDAQDRLIDEKYGRCGDCDAAIESKRLVADPAASRCVACQTSLEAGFTFDRRSRVI